MSFSLILCTCLMTLYRRKVYATSGRVTFAIFKQEDIVLISEVCFVRGVYITTDKKRMTCKVRGQCHLINQNDYHMKKGWS